MRVLLDARALPAHRLGVAQYVLRLVEHVAPRCELEVLAKPRDAAELAELGARVHEARDLPRPLRLAAEATVDGLLARRHAPDVFHGIHYSLPPLLGVPSTVTFHDATMLTMPEVHEAAKVRWFRHAIPSGVRRADRVVCVSEATRRGAIDAAGADPGRTHVVPLGVDHDRYHPGAGDPALAAAVVEGPYVLGVGAIEPRKDHPTLVRAFEAVAAEVPHSLVLAGPDAWGADALDAVLAASPVADRVVRAGWVDEDTKTALYAGADAFAYPSLAEGFGLPVLEALACGTPTVTTTGSACEEVAGDAALLVAPGDVAGLADALRTILLGDAARLRDAGPERAASFTWDACAEGHLEVWGWACA